MSNQKSSELGLGKQRVIESPSYSLSSKIDELNTQSRSKRSNYEFANESKGPASQKYAREFSNFKKDYDEIGYDSFHEDQAFMFSLPPDDDDEYSAYSMIGVPYPQRTPITEFDILASDGGDQIDLLMNAYSKPTASAGFYQSGGIPVQSYKKSQLQNQLNEQYVPFGGMPNYSSFPLYSNEQYNNIHGNEKLIPAGVRQLSSNAIAGQMMTNNGMLIMSPGNRISSNIVYIPPQSNNMRFNNR